MKNRYCLFCGTLLPEDGVCLRCGAKYELADDGQLKVIPRKVRKVSAKPVPKKKFTVKKTADASEAETQTIALPEDIFSYSENGDQSIRHADWTNNNQIQEEAEIVQPVNTSSVKNMNNTAKLFVIFLGFACLAGIITFSFLHHKQPNSDQLPTTNQLELPNSEQANKENDFSVIYNEPTDPVSYFNNLCITDEKGNEKVRYEYDPKTKQLNISTITGSLSNDEYWLKVSLLPLISPEKRNNNLLIGSFVRHEDMGLNALSDDSLEIIFALSEYIRSGMVATVNYEGTHYSFDVDQSDHLVKTINNKYINDENDSDVFKSVLSYENNRLTRVRHDYTQSDSYYERVFTYNKNGLLSQYRYKWYEKHKDEETNGPKLRKIEEAWVYNYSDEGVLTNAVGSLEEAAFHNVYVFNKNGQLIRMEEHFDSDNTEDYSITHSFSYNEEGELSRLIKDTGDKDLDPIANFEYSSPLSESTIPWRLAYQDHLQELLGKGEDWDLNQKEYYRFAFFKRYNNDVPVLYVSGDTTGASHVCVFDGAKVVSRDIETDYYLENAHAFIDEGGRMDYYHTNVIGLRSGGWETLFEGTFHAEHNSVGHFDSFKIGEKAVSRDQFNNALLDSFKEDAYQPIDMKEINYDRLLSYDECMEMLTSGAISFYSGDAIDYSKVLIPPTYNEWINNRN